MKKLTSIMVIIIVAAGFLAAGNSRAEAMDNGSAAAITAGMFLLGIPVIHAIAQEAAHHDHAYGYSCPPRYIERTKVVYAPPRHKRFYRQRHRDHDGQWERRWDRNRDRRWSGDSDRDSRRRNGDH